MHITDSLVSIHVEKGGGCRVKLSFSRPKMLMSAYMALQRLPIDDDLFRFYFAE
jgi:hypothetical protein